MRHAKAAINDRSRHDVFLDSTPDGPSLHDLCSTTHTPEGYDRTDKRQGVEGRRRDPPAREETLRWEAKATDHTQTP